VTLVRPDTELGWDKRIAGEDGQVGQTVKGCWAASLGDCKGKISREHLVSECLLPEGGIRVSGFPWCKDEPKFVGNAALVGNILCEKHNSELSELDSSAKRSFDILNESWRLYGIRSKIINRRWPQKTFIIDGVLLERWFVKTFINLIRRSNGARCGGLYTSPRVGLTDWEEVFESTRDRSDTGSLPG